MKGKNKRECLKIIYIATVRDGARESNRKIYVKSCVIKIVCNFINVSTVWKL